MTNPSESVCVRGCLGEDRHYAQCASYGVKGGECTGCAPAKTHRGTVLCERCYLRVRGILRVAPDLLGRMRTLIEQGKAAAYSHSKVPGRRAGGPVQVDSELLDALNEIEGNLRAWYRLIDPRTLDGLIPVLSDRHQMERLWAATLDRHMVNEEGDRLAWSLADAAARWGVERRDRGAQPWEPEGVQVVERVPIAEHGDPILTRVDAAQLAGSERTLQRWVKEGHIAPEGRMVIAGTTTVWYRRSDVLRVRDEMREAGKRGRFKSPPPALEA